MSAVIADLLDGDLGAREVNAVCNASGKLLKTVEMQYKYGKRLEKEEMQQIAPQPPALGLVS